MDRELVFSLTKKDFRLDWFSGQGAGGQKRNKTQNCLRITHIETGITAQCTDYSNRPANQKVAFNRLVEKLQPWIRKQVVGVKEENLRSSDVVRTYHIPDNRVKDHASGYQQSWDVASNDLTKMIDARWGEMIKTIVSD